MTDHAKLYHVKNAREIAGLLQALGRRIEALAGVRCAKCLLLVISDNVDECQATDCPHRGVPLRDLLAIEIEALDLPTRTRNGLRQWGLETVGDLVVLSDREVLRMPEIAKFGLERIKEALASMGLRLGMEIKE